MNSPFKSSALESLGVLRARGADVVPFLQGQLSNDIAQLSAGRSLLAGYHNPQGRTIALLRLIEHAPGRPPGDPATRTGRAGGGAVVEVHPALEGETDR